MIAARAQDVGDLRPPQWLTVVATSRERAEAESLIRAANENEPKDALRDRIRQAGFVLREKGESLFAFSPLVAATQADYDLQALACLLTEQKPLECPQLRAWLSLELEAKLQHRIALEEQLVAALREQRPELADAAAARQRFTPDMTAEKFLSQCSPQVQFTARVWVAMEFDPTRGATSYELMTLPLTDLKLPSDLLNEIKRSETQLPPYEVWKKRDKEYLFLFSNEVGAEWFRQKRMMEEAVAELDKIRQSAQKRIAKLDEAVAREVERRHKLSQGKFTYNDLPASMQNQIREIHRRSPVFEWMEVEKPSESRLEKARYEFDFRPTIQATFECDGRKYQFTAELEPFKGGILRRALIPLQ